MDRNLEEGQHPVYDIYLFHSQRPCGDAARRYRTLRTDVPPALGGGAGGEPGGPCAGEPFGGLLPENDHEAVGQPVLRRYKKCGSVHGDDK